MAANSRKTGLLAALAAGAMLLAVYMIFFYLPPIRDESGAVLSGSFRIFFFHMPIAITAYLAFVVVFVSSVFYLREKALKWDIYARSAAEIGALFSFLVLVTGSIWAKDAWGWYWIWDLRLTTSLVLFLVYLSYLMLRKSLEEPEKRARLAAVFGIVGFVSVPLSFLSIRLWRSAHPLMFGGNSGGSGGSGLEGTVLQLTLAVNFIAYILLFAALFAVKVENERMQEAVDEKRYGEFEEGI
ncbi:Cytochrome c-type biogenesis protein CcmC, putative heme lyase for CcmE [Methanosarcina sp. MTP4]|uniref:cytochrome c biogenesis protein n=1 Tax=Methanosarcina sp. MTP4 TaxID=1434100 RepID=UPI0006155128|nr:cytochrome c biogenesis protein [Methanosarcina sp. MTP4]AKB24504.1 Cytochrome c-type biogenesis protein CcmC, putative heme lyase for CcmE [Methanosarcina sp. MTP4]